MNKSELCIRLFQHIGIDITHEGYLKDQDTNRELYMEGKLIKYIDPMSDVSTIAYTNRNIEVPFNPFLNTTILQLILSHYINKISEENNLHFNGIYVTKDGDKFSVVLRDIFNGDMSSRFFKNPCLAYIDMIYIISGEWIELSIYDLK